MYISYAYISMCHPTICVAVTVMYSDGRNNLALPVSTKAVFYGSLVTMLIKTILRISVFQSSIIDSELKRDKANFFLMTTSTSTTRYGHYGVNRLPMCVNRIVANIVLVNITETLHM
jgi:hypothetical protein